ncbi:MAG: ATP synthase F0 subunit A, partial [Eggerthellaceae bacterium]|nr:ATP synthase F0 subunit A [Eggerthellaceae bacterium]
MNPLESLAEQIPELKASFNSANVFGSGSFGLTQYVFWMIVIFVIVVAVVLAASKRLSLVPGGSKFVGLVEYGYSFIRKDIAEETIGHG